jgi:hypothetical protein
MEAVIANKGGKKHSTKERETKGEGKRIQRGRRTKKGRNRYRNTEGRNTAKISKKREMETNKALEENRNKARERNVCN